MAKFFSIKDLPRDVKIALLKELGYGSDNVFVLDPSTNEKVIDKYIDEPVRIDNMFLYPGSTIILDNNPL
ncbi:MAG: hypothetical protein IIA82_02695, partial [Thaumarchaeota archaeon]|nr:hypothetical protein [Nitrososphaerota archaeon]